MHFSPESILKARAIEERLYEQTWQRSSYDLVEPLKTFQKPTLVLHGKQDFLPLACANNIALASPAAGVRRYTWELFGALARRGTPRIVAVGVPDGVPAPAGIVRAAGAWSLPTNAGWISARVAARRARRRTATGRSRTSATSSTGT